MNLRNVGFGPTRGGNQTAMRVIRSLLVAAAAIGALVAVAGGAASAGSDGRHQFVVVYKKGASLESARAAVKPAWAWAAILTFSFSGSSGPMLNSGCRSR